MNIQERLISVNMLNIHIPPMHKGDMNNDRMQNFKIVILFQPIFNKYMRNKPQELLIVEDVNTHT